MHSHAAAQHLLELPCSRALAPATPLSRFSLLLDPDQFGDVAFFAELHSMGYSDVLQSAPRCHLTVSDEVSPTRAYELAQHGVDTMILPSNVLEEAADPLALAHRYLARLLE